MKCTLGVGVGLRSETVGVSALPQLRIRRPDGPTAHDCRALPASGRMCVLNTFGNALNRPFVFMIHAHHQKLPDSCSRCHGPPAPGSGMSPKRNRFVSAILQRSKGSVLPARTTVRVSRGYKNRQQFEGCAVGGGAGDGVHHMKEVN